MKPKEEKNNNPTPEQPVDAQAAAPQEEAPQGPSLEEQLKAAEQKRDEYLDLAQRVQAEFDNFRRRNNAARSEAWFDGARETVLLMLPVIDNLERALAAQAEKTPFRDGVEMVHRQMLEVLSKRGVTEIDCLGKPFDPELENAVAQADSSEGEPGTVCTVLQKGYKTENRVVRHAMVRVVAAD